MSLRGGGRAARAGRRRARAGRLRLARLGGQDPRLPGRTRAARSRTSASASACTSPSPSSRATSSASTAPTRPRWIPRRRIPVIDLLPEQKDVEDLGGTMRLGAQAVELAEGTRARELYGEAVIHERHRHRYEVNNHLPRAADRRAASSSPGRSRKAASSRSSSYPITPGSSRASSTRSSSRGRRGPAPLFRDFVGAALDRARVARRRAARRPLVADGSRPRRRTACPATGRLAGAVLNATVVPSLRVSVGSPCA